MRVALFVIRGNPKEDQLTPSRQRCTIGQGPSSKSSDGYEATGSLRDRSLSTPWQLLHQERPYRLVVSRSTPRRHADGSTREVNRCPGKGESTGWPVRRCPVSYTHLPARRGRAHRARQHHAPEYRLTAAVLSRQGPRRAGTRRDRRVVRGAAPRHPLWRRRRAPQQLSLIHISGSALLITE